MLSPEIENQFEMLRRYMDIYIQLLPATWECGGRVRPVIDLPDFEYFKSVDQDERYSMSVPHYKESIGINVIDIYRGTGNLMYKIPTHGLGSEEGIATRHYNRWGSIKYFTGGNISGDFFIHNAELNQILKSA